MTKVMENRNAHRCAAFIAALGILGGAGTTALADITWAVTASDTSGRSAEADFDINTAGTILTMTLKNTGKLASVPTDVLTALFFSVNNATIAPIAGDISTPGFAPNQPAFGNTLGGAWSYNPIAPGTGSTGLGNVWGVGSPNLYWETPNGPNPQTGKGVDGVNFGIITGVASGANTPITTGVFEEPSVTFGYSVVSGVPLTQSDITVLKFQYGTQDTDPSLTPVPEPTTLIAGALLLLPFGASTLRILRKRAA